MTLGYTPGTGTVSVAVDGTAVAGTGTAFTTEAMVGGTFEALGLMVRIASIASDTELALSLPWPGAAITDGSAFNFGQLPASAALSLQFSGDVREYLTQLGLKGEIHYVTAAPLAALGDDGDTAIDTTPPGALYGKAEGAWSLVLSSLKGEDGESFKIDAVGLAADRSTHDAKPALFAFLAEDTGQIAVKRSATSGDWSAWIDFQGPPGDPGNPGDPGDPGAPGADGSAWSAGATPGPGDGVDGDFHLEDDGDVLGKVAGLWAATSVNLKGPPGDQGDPGNPGQTGPQGRSFDPDAQEPAANRVNYDAEADGFAFLATDTNQVSWKQSATPGDWSGWVDWGGGGSASGAGSTTPLGMFVAASL